MIVITNAEMVGFPPVVTELLLNASWLDGTRFTYKINHRGIQVEGAAGPKRRWRRGTIRSFTLAAQQDVWALLLTQRTNLLRESWRGIVNRLVLREPRSDAPNQEVGTAFGTQTSAMQIARALRSLGYAVAERPWNELFGRSGCTFVSIIDSSDKMDV